MIIAYGFLPSVTRGTTLAVYISLVIPSSVSYTVILCHVAVGSRVQLSSSALRAMWTAWLWLWHFCGGSWRLRLLPKLHPPLFLAFAQLMHVAQIWRTFWGRSVVLIAEQATVSYLCLSEPLASLTSRRYVHFPLFQLLGDIHSFDQDYLHSHLKPSFLTCFLTPRHSTLRFLSIPSCFVSTFFDVLADEH